MVVGSEDTRELIFDVASRWSSLEGNVGITQVRLRQHQSFNSYSSQAIQDLDRLFQHQLQEQKFLSDLQRSSLSMFRSCFGLTLLKQRDSSDVEVEEAFDQRNLPPISSKKVEKARRDEICGTKCLE